MMTVVGREVGLHRALADPHRVRILELLRTAGPQDARELGRALGLHPNTVRSHAALLRSAGLVRSAAPRQGGPGRPRVLYEAVDASPEAQAGEPGYQLLAQILASHLAGTDPEPAAAAREAGRAWGRFLLPPAQPFAPTTIEASTERVAELLDTLGFVPEVRRDDGLRVLLHRCPFREAALANQTVVCAVHLGLLQGALEEIRAPLTATRLDPWVEPMLCVAHLEAAATPAAEQRAARRGRDPHPGS